MLVNKNFYLIIRNTRKKIYCQIALKKIQKLFLLIIKMSQIVKDLILVLLRLRKIKFRFLLWLRQDRQNNFTYRVKKQCYKQNKK